MTEAARYGGRWSPVDTVRRWSSAVHGGPTGPRRERWLRRRWHETRCPCRVALPRRHGAGGRRDVREGRGRHMAPPRGTREGRALGLCGGRHRRVRSPARPVGGRGGRPSAVVVPGPPRGRGAAWPGVRPPFRRVCRRPARLPGRPGGGRGLPGRRGRGAGLLSGRTRRWQGDTLLGPFRLESSWRQAGYVRVAVQWRRGRGVLAAEPTP